MPDQKEKLEKKLNLKSFKIKPVFLEFQNYSYYHASIQGDEEKLQDRFVGRKKIIAKILSFVHESSNNTGTYLVTGFRGMGKTSVVNKALSKLNPTIKIGFYVKLWVMLLPLVIFWNNFQILSNHIKKVLEEGNFTIPIVLLGAYLIFSLIVVYSLGYWDPRVNRLNKKHDRFTKFLKTLWSGLEALFNSKFNKSKNNFQRITIFVFVYVLIIGLHILCEIFLFDDKVTRHHVFWFFTSLVILSYWVVDVYKATIRLFKSIGHRKTNQNHNYHSYIKKAKIVSLIIVFVIFCWLIFCSAYLNWFIISSITLFLLLIIARIIVYIKRKEESVDLSENYLNGVFRNLDFQQYIVTNVNLGKDNLTEKEVLKYVADEIYREYSSWFYNIFNPQRLVNVFFVFFLFYFIVSMFYTKFLDKQFMDFTNKTFQMSIYFPSQALQAQDSLRLDDLNYLFVKENKSQTNLDEYSMRIKNVYKRKVLNNDLGKPNSYIGYGSAKILFENTGFSSQWLNTYMGFVKICNELDYLSLKLWYNVRLVLINDIFDNDGNEYLKRVVNKIYPRVPILPVFLFILFFLFLIRTVPSRFLPFKTHSSTLRKLRRIRNQIDAAITFEQSGHLTGVKPIWSSLFQFKRQFHYKSLGAKDISQKLIHFLQDVEKLSSLFVRVKFIVVFDELDKINPHYKAAISSQEDEFESDNSEVRYLTRRKERISLILSSMKHFLNTAKAKFIFIAGREMYEAALAGISDRESSLDSIFNDNKIYVESFYKEIETKSLNDLTSITEEYLCKFLIPHNYYIAQSLTPSLKVYNNYLTQYFEKTYDELLENLSATEKQKVNTQKREKIISLLKEFILYLTYRSNGAPQKLANLLENHLRPVTEKELTDNDVLYVGKNTNNLYLDLGYYRQYKFSLISYLTTPVFLGLGNYMHEYSDKLLVSISYMLDHLFKHHKFGISYRNLSLTPELVDVNKEPQFQEFLDKLVYTLSKSHIRPILSGIYDYRFNSKVASEIKFLSRIDAFEGAALNFTLDESIELKRHFNRRLNQLKEVHNKTIVTLENNTKNNHVHSISHLNVMIGDLHFYDDEYQEAIIHYLEAIQQLLETEIEKMDMYNFVFFVRTKLKLGLAYEKNKMYDNALLTYSELAHYVSKKRNIPLKKFGLARFVVTNRELKSLKKTCKSINNGKKLNRVIKKELKGKGKTELVVIGRLKANPISNKDSHPEQPWQRIYPISDMDSFYSLDDKGLTIEMDKLGTNYRPLKHYFLKTTLENVRLFYQPTVAKLYMIEKSSPDKLCDIDILRAIKEFNFLKLPLKSKQKRMIVSEFYNKLGDLLYYKNGTMNRCLRRLIIDEMNKIQKDKKNKNDEIKEKLNQQINAYKNLLMSPVDASLFYIKSIAALLIPNNSVCVDKPKKAKIENINIYKFYSNNFKSLKSFKKLFNDKVKLNLNAINNEIECLVNTPNLRESYSYEYLYAITNGLLDLNQCLLCFTKCSYSYKNAPEEVKFIYKILGHELDDLLRSYFLAHLILQTIGEYSLAKSQLLKIIYIINQVNSDTSISLNKINPDLTLDDLFERCIRLIYSSHDESYYVDDYKIMRILKHGDSPDKNASLNSVARSDIQEVISLYWLSQNHLRDKKPNKYSGITKTKEDFYQFIYGTYPPFQPTQRKQNRILELSLRLKANSELYDKMDNSDNGIKKFKELIHFKGKDNSTLKEFLILDSLGSCNELLKIYNLLDVDYINNTHLMMAKTHFIMGEWCDKFERYCKTLNDDASYMEEILKVTVLNTNTLMYLDPFYHYSNALKHNTKAVNFHSRGESLIEYTRRASYLDDFYNDNIAHLHVALERKEVHERHNPKIWREITKKIDEAGIHEIANYIN